MDINFSEHNSKKTQKSELRRMIKSKYKAIPKFFRDAIDAKICKNVEAMPEYIKSQNVFLFYGIDWEINTLPLIEHAIKSKKTVVLPLCIDKIHMEARQIFSLNDLVKGSYNIPEPSPKCPLVNFSDIDFALVPCVACDKSGMRLGQGAGYYDRVLGNASFYKTVICRESGILTEIPQDPWDISVDCVVTENSYFYSVKSL